jgi:uncharacterized protein YndB with AHSA1/START domain
VKALVTKQIDWIDQAPIRVQGSGSSSAPPEAVFAVLADHERWPEWFPRVTKAEVLGVGEGVGARRKVSVPGMAVEEEFIVWEPGTRFSFTATSARPALFRSLVEDCRLTARGDGGTDMTYTMYIDAPAVVRTLLRLMGRALRANNTKAMANLGRRAAAAGA